jgi:hypothetical protein
MAKTKAEYAALDFLTSYGVSLLREGKSIDEMFDLVHERMREGVRLGDNPRRVYLGEDDFIRATADASIRHDRK